MDDFMHDLCRLVKPGNRVNVFEEGYFCSNCDSKLDDDEAWWHYCPHCLVNYDCCEEVNEPCDICGQKLAKLVLEKYRSLRK
jgi:hypothetical protein